MNACPICKFKTHETRYGTVNTCVHFVTFRKRIKERGHLPPETVIEAIYEAVSLPAVEPSANRRR